MAAVAASVGALALGGATSPSTLAGVKAGMWELEGLPGTHGPARACLAVETLAAAQGDGRVRLLNKADSLVLAF